MFLGLKAFSNFCLLLATFAFSSPAYAGQQLPYGFFRSASAPACAGTLFAGFCWYYGGVSQSCDTACATHGGYHAATLTYAGSAGTNANCKAVMDALGVPSSTVTDDGFCMLGLQYTGCVYNATSRFRCTNGPTNSSGSLINRRRVCACNN